MAAKLRRLPGHDVIVHPLVVREIETEFLQTLFQIPIGFGQEEKTGTISFHRLNGFTPELRSRRWCIARKSIPGLGKDCVENEHGHVAATAVTLGGDVMQDSDHRGARFPTAVLELRGVSPCREVRIFAVSEPAPAGLDFTAKTF